MIRYTHSLGILVKKFTRSLLFILLDNKTYKTKNRHTFMSFHKTRSKQITVNSSWYQATTSIICTVGSWLFFCRGISILYPAVLTRLWIYQSWEMKEVSWLSLSLMVRYFTAHDKNLFGFGTKILSDEKSSSWNIYVYQEEFYRKRMMLTPH